MDMYMENKIKDSKYLLKVVALIPARGGSKGIPKKNIRLVKGYPLIAYSIAAAKLTKNIDRVIVSTDSTEIGQIARKFGAEVPFLRPEEFATDTSPDIEFVTHALNWFDTNEGVVPDFLVHLRPTVPLREPEVIDAAIEAIFTQSNASALRSGTVSNHPPYKWLIKRDDNFLNPLMPNMTIDETNMPRQSFSNAYCPNGYVDVLRSKDVLKNKLMYGEKVLSFDTEITTDIDCEAEFDYLEYQLTKGQRQVYEYLRTHF